MNLKHQRHIVVNLILGVLFGGLITWLVALLYHKRSALSLKREVASLSAQLGATDTLEYFQHLVSVGTWRSAYVGSTKVWRSQERPTFQIHMRDNDRPFDELWSRGFPDPNASAFSVQLRIGEAVIDELTFVSLDGARIIIPVPDRILVDDEPHYFWDPESLAFRIGRIIGSYYIFEDIEGVARRCGIDILRQRNYRQE